MTKKIILCASGVLLFALMLVSCGKDKAPHSEKNEVQTSKNGAVYRLDTLASAVEWKGYKIVDVRSGGHFGTIKFESGDVTVHEGRLESGKFVADMASLTSVDLKNEEKDLGKLNSHLKSDDFFDVEKFPTASYEITKVTPAESGDYNTAIDGNLTIKGITKPVQFMANVVLKDGSISIATEPKDINREDFGVKFQMPVANGVVKNEMTIQVLIKANESK